MFQVQRFCLLEDFWKRTYRKNSEALWRSIVGSYIFHVPQGHVAQSFSEFFSILVKYSWHLQGERFFSRIVSSSKQQTRIIHVLTHVVLQATFKVEITSVSSLLPICQMKSLRFFFHSLNKGHSCESTRACKGSLPRAEINHKSVRAMLMKHSCVNRNYHERISQLFLVTLKRLSLILNASSRVSATVNSCL